MIVSLSSSPGYSDNSTVATGMVSAVRTVKLICDGKKTLFKLPDTEILPGFFQIRFLGEDVISRDDYQFRAKEGELEFSQPPEKGKIIVVKYIRYPEFRDEELDLAGLEGTGNYFEIDGSKNFTVSVASDQEITLDQGTRINFNGRVGAVDIEGHLTDEQLPIQPEGTTEELADIDKVSVELHGEYFDIHLGDLEVSSTEMEFSSYDKHLLGFDSRFNYKNNEFGALLSREKGYHYTVEFRGRDGVQGPYLLTVEGEDYVVVIADSERVYVDGERVKRGEKNDYIIDYQEPSITFTNNITITSDTRIVVEFEYTGLGYKRTFFTSGSNLQTEGGTIELGVRYCKELDSKQDDLVALSDEDKKILYRAGDDSDSARRFAEDEDGNPIYEYAGEGYGDYIREWDPIEQEYTYTYVGEGGGDFKRLMWQIPMPKDHDILDISLGLEPFEHLRVDLEMAGSSIDRNTFSPYNDDDNVGGAGKINIISDWDVGDDSLLSFILKGRGREYMYEGLMDLEDVEMKDEWRLEGDYNNFKIPPSHYLIEGGSTFKMASGLNLGGFYGIINRDYPATSDFWKSRSGKNIRIDGDYVGDSTDFEFSTKYLKYESVYKINESGEGIDDVISYQELARDFLEVGGLYERRFWIIMPRFDFDYHRVRANLNRDDIYNKGENLLKLNPRIKLEPTEWLYLNLGFGYEKKREFIRDKLHPHSFTREYISGGGISGNSWDFSVNIKNRRTYFSDTYQENVFTDQVNMDLRVSPESRLVFLTGRYIASGEMDYQREEVFEIAPDLNGDYRREEDPNNPGRYIYIYDPEDEDAIYIRILRPTGDSFLVMDVEGFLSTQLNLWRSKEEESPGYSIKNSTIRVSFSSHNRTTDPERYKVLTFMNRLNQFTIKGSVRQSYSLQLFTVGCRLSPTLGFERKSSLNRETVHTSRRNWQNIYSVDTFMDISSGVNLTAGVTIKDYHMRYSSKGLETERGTDGMEYALKLISTFIPVQKLRITVEGDALLMRESNDNYETRAYNLSLNPRAQLYIVEGGTLNLSYGLSFVGYSGHSGSYFFITNPPGFTNEWKAVYSHRVNQNTTLTLYYSGEKEPNRDLKNEAKFDISLFF